MNRLRQPRSPPTLAVATAGILGALGCPGAGATDPDVPAQSAPERLKFEVSPFVGYRFGGTFDLIDTGTHVDVDNHTSFALALDLWADEVTQYELFYSRQSTSVSGQSLAPSDLDVEYLHIGGTVLLDNSQRLQPYLVGGLGATRFTPNSAVGHNSAYFSASLGAGLRVPFNRHFSLRLEARGFATILNSNTDVFCRSDQSGGLCRIHGRGSAFIQGDLLAGAAYAF